MDTGMPSISVVPKDASSRLGYDAVQKAFGDGAPGAFSAVVPADAAAAVQQDVGSMGSVTAVMPAGTSKDRDFALLQIIPDAAPSTDAMRATVDAVREALPNDALLGGAAVEQHDLERALSDRTALVLGIVLALGFALLLVALQAPLLALVGVLTNLLATGAAFGIAVWLFQDEYLITSIGIEPQGYLNAWAPVFFFAMVFAIAMDYTVFLLSSAKEHHDRGEGAKAAMVGGLAHSGRVIMAAGAVMVAVFFTFALQGPLPPREMGIILGVAVLLDALIVRLVLVPAILALLGERAWACPAWLRRILPNVKFGH
jgi:RND superfamily putative drug exporter